MKRCARCGETKAVDDFPADRRRRDGRFSYCKACHAGLQGERRKAESPADADQRRARDRDRYAEWRASDPERTAAAIQANARLRRYGITYADYERLLESQGGTCAFATCERTPAQERFRRLNLDHCHATGMIRGLLCWQHNSLLGNAADDEDALLDAIDYLSCPPAEGVLGSRLVPCSSQRAWDRAPDDRRVVAATERRRLGDIARRRVRELRRPPTSSAISE